MDFEFSPINRYSKVLISGAISNSLDRFKITKLEGRPLYLPKEDEEVRPMSDREMRQAIKEIHRVFVKKPELRDACLEQFRLSIKTKSETLNAAFIKNYLQRDNKQCVIVLFSGSSDKEVLYKLGIVQYTMLNILCYDTTQTQHFYLKLENLRTRQLICEIDVGYYDKKGRLLNLVETHNLICKKKHKVTHAHDPCTDVKYTKCIFDFIIRSYRYVNLVKHC